MAESGKGSGIPEDGFKTNEQLQAWLKGQPRQVALALASRSALRTLPLLAAGDPNVALVPAFRALALSRFASVWPAYEAETVAGAAQAAASAASAAAESAVSVVSLNTAAFASHAVAMTSKTAVRSAVAISASAIYAGSYANAVWLQATLDAELCDERGVEALNKAPLWFASIDKSDFSKPVDWAEDGWVKLRRELREQPRDHQWSVWIDWYDDIFHGKPGLTRDRDIEFARLFGLEPETIWDGAITYGYDRKITENDWEAGPAVVNPKIKQVLDWFKEHDQSKANSGNDNDSRTNAPEPSISTLILQVLEQSDHPVRRGDILDYVRSRRPYTQPNSIGFRITELVRARKILRVDRGLYTIVDQSNGVKELPAPDFVQPQTIGAAQFKLNDDGRADLDALAGVVKLLTDRDARDRHAETKRLAQKLRTKAQSTDTRGNAKDEIVEGTELVLEALGDRVEDLRPGKLITRGEALRQLHQHNQKRDQYSDLPPLPDDVALLLANWVTAYNQMVGLDPVLAKSDEARLGPDARKNLVSPEQGRALAQSALKVGAATEEAVNALEEEAKVAPQVPDAENRNSVRHSEAQKNFVRTIVRGVVASAKLGWKHKGKLTVGAGGSVAAAKWVLANQVTLLDMFASNPTMHHVIKTLIEVLKTMPLA